MVKLKQNGLRLTTKATKVELFNKKIDYWDHLNSVLAETFATDGYIVAYLHYKILIGEFTNGKMIFYQEEIFDPKYLIKLRIFNADKELLIWSSGENSFKGRFRIDEGYEEQKIVVAHQVLWGRTKARLDDGWIQITEKRGTKIILPVDPMLEIKLPVKIKTHNYICHSDDGQASYADCRFVGFLFEEGCK